ncbi:ANK-REP-REGION domain-containing protein [Mycena chlorophos]|uniref:ANK-REP-REGION domain-containing protein n=1 Tax=Mycena chlorophos TaxID=658473 RepID=A0A8H6SMG3_MYCCL|nr:ANK-REP-REGION domain-containing protein [Mycena chlorophos]
MPTLCDLPPELILLVVSQATRDHLARVVHKSPSIDVGELLIVPDLALINALARTCKSLYNLLDAELYRSAATTHSEIGRLAILFAIEHHREESLEKLVASGVSLDTHVGAADDGFLHAAARQGDVSMVRKLLHLYGDGMSAWALQRLGPGRYPRTALDVAAKHNHIDVVRVLVEIPIPLESRTEYIGRALCAATSAENVSLALVRLLVSVQPDAIDYNGETSPQLGIPPITCAIYDNQIATVQLLLELGANPNTRKTGGQTPLHIAANGLSVAQVEIVEALIAHGADVNARNEENDTPLHLALAAAPADWEHERTTQPGHTEKTRRMIHHLLEQGADVHRADVMGVHADSARGVARRCRVHGRHD